MLFDGQPLDPEDKHLGSEFWNKWLITTHFQEPCLGVGVRNQLGSPGSQWERRWRHQWEVLPDSKHTYKQTVRPEPTCPFQSPPTTINPMSPTHLLTYLWFKGALDLNFHLISHIKMLGRRILLSHEKDEILPFAVTWMDLEGIMLSEIRQKKTNTVWYHLRVESKKYNTLVNITKKKQTHRYREQTSGYQLGRGVPLWDGGRVGGTNYYIYV